MVNDFDTVLKETAHVFSDVLGEPVTYYPKPENSDELVTGGDFSSWPGGVPNGWTVVGGEHPAEVTQVGTGEGNGGSGTGYCNIYTSEDNSVLIKQTLAPLVVGWSYKVSLKVDTITEGEGIIVYDSPTTMFSDKFYAVPGTYTFTFVATATSMDLYIARMEAEITDVTFDDISVKFYSREITAVVEREGLQPVKGLPAGRSVLLTVDVENDAESGISSDEIDTGADEIGVPLRIGKAAPPRAIAKIVAQDAGREVLAGG